MNTSSPATTQLTSRELTTAARRTGGLAGRAAAGWWAQDTTGGHAGDHHSAATANRILTALEHGDPAIYDDLPAPTASEIADAYDETAPPAAPYWHHLPAPARETFDTAYTDAYITAMTTRITRICRHTLAPARSRNTTMSDTSQQPGRSRPPAPGQPAAPAAITTS